MAGLRPLFSDREVSRFMDKFQSDAEQKFIEVLSYAGEQGVRTARENGRYNDITGNLRSSIGYAILKDGAPIREDYTPAGSGSEGPKGVNQAKRLVSEVALTHNKGFVLVMVAGMDYALFVETMQGKDVLGSTVIGTEKFLKDTLKKVVNG